MEAIILAGGKAERLGGAAGGRPKALVDVGGRPLAAWQVGQLARAGVGRVIISCAAGKEEEFTAGLAGLGPEIVAVAEAEPLGRGGGLRFAAAARSEEGPVFALNGDELLDVDLTALLAHHQAIGASATIVVGPLMSQFELVDLEDDFVTGFRKRSRLPFWVNAGCYVFEDEALERLPDRGDHEATTFPELVRERKLGAYRHEGVWLTVNTPKELRQAQEFVASHPEFLAA